MQKLTEVQKVLMNGGMGHHLRNKKARPEADGSRRLRNIAAAARASRDEVKKKAKARA